MNLQLQQLQDDINKLRRKVESLTFMFNQNNFPSSQDFNKTCRFNTSLKIPHYTSAPTTNEVGQLIEIGGKLYISTAVDTWTICGTQS